MPEYIVKLVRSPYQTKITLPALLIKESMFKDVDFVKIKLIKWNRLEVIPVGICADSK